MKHLWIGVAVAAAATAWAWWLHERGQEAVVVATHAEGAASARAGIDDGMLRKPSNPDPGMLRKPSNPDPMMAVNMSQVHAAPGASGNGREE
jgi:hypothetical protein